MLKNFSELMDSERNFIAEGITTIRRCMKDTHVLTAKEPVTGTIPGTPALNLDIEGRLDLFSIRDLQMDPDTDSVIVNYYDEADKAVHPINLAGCCEFNGVSNIYNILDFININAA